MKKILIVFPDPQILFSPSTLNLYESLSVFYDVTILTFEPDPNYSSKKIDDKNILYLKYPNNPNLPLLRGGLKEIFKRFNFKKRNFLLLNGRASVLIKEIKKFDGEIIAVDFFALWCVKMANKKAHLLSLEIFEDDNYRDFCSISDIKSVIIQSEERYQYLFGDQKLKTFFVQNAPNLINEKIDYQNRNKNELVYCGSAIPGFGIFNCLEFLEDFPEYRLTIKGVVPPQVKTLIEQYFSDLLNQNRLVINQEYLSLNDLNSYLTRFRIGFVFYDFLRFECINTFNYQTAPSGKLFQYYNAGIPVISNNSPGFSSVEKFQTGVTIKSMGSMAIKNAIERIELDYENYAIRAKKMSEIYDFNKNIVPFIDYINESL